MPRGANTQLKRDPGLADLSCRWGLFPTESPTAGCLQDSETYNSKADLDMTESRDTDAGSCEHEASAVMSSFD